MSDVKFAKKLSKLRNGIAHKNPRKISNSIYSAKELSFLDIESAMNKYDPIPIFIGAIRLLIKMSKARK